MAGKWAEAQDFKGAEHPLNTEDGDMLVSVSCSKQEATDQGLGTRDGPSKLRNCLAITSPLRRWNSKARLSLSLDQVLDLVERTL